MNDQEPNGIAPEETAPEEAAAEEETIGAVGPSTEQQLDELNQRLLRVSADYQNFVKRSQANLQVSLDQQLMGLARDLVTVMDHFDRALEVDPESTSADDLLSGVKSIHGELIKTLAKYGIERVDVEPGDVFDPNLHQALMRTAHDDIESNHVVQQFQPGYALKDKTIRPAGVSVAE